LGGSISHQDIDNLSNSIALWVKNPTAGQSGYEYPGCAHRDKPMGHNQPSVTILGMSDSRASARSRRTGPTIPTGHTLGNFANHKEASVLVEKLIAGDFSPQKVSIIGHDPVMVERIRGRLGYGRIAASGAITGLWIGLLIALLLGSGVQMTQDGSTEFLAEQFISVVSVAAGIGMLLNILRFAASKNKRGFLSTQMPVASRYEVIVPEVDAPKALGILSASSTAK
jgi:hypothetical protein